MRRKDLLAIVGGLRKCLIGMEACATSHFWGRCFTEIGHEVRLIPPAYVKAYVRRQKNDAADAAAICEAVSRPSMRFVPIKSREQQALLLLHRGRELLVGQRVGLISAGTSPSSVSWLRRVCGTCQVCWHSSKIPMTPGCRSRCVPRWRR